MQLLQHICISAIIIAFVLQSLIDADTINLKKTVKTTVVTSRHERLFGKCFSTRTLIFLSSRIQMSSPQWLLIEFNQPVFIEAVRIYAMDYHYFGISTHDITYGASDVAVHIAGDIKFWHFESGCKPGLISARLQQFDSCGTTGTAVKLTDVLTVNCSSVMAAKFLYLIKYVAKNQVMAFSSMMVLGKLIYSQVAVTTKNVLKSWQSSAYEGHNKCFMDNAVDVEPMYYFYSAQQPDHNYQWLLLQLKSTFIINMVQITARESTVNQGMPESETAELRQRAQHIVVYAGYHHRQPLINKYLHCVIEFSKVKDEMKKLLKECGKTGDVPDGGVVSVHCHFLKANYLLFRKFVGSDGGYMNFESIDLVVYEPAASITVSSNATAEFTFQPGSTAQFLVTFQSPENITNYECFFVAPAVAITQLYKLNSTNQTYYSSKHLVALNISLNFRVTNEFDNPKFLCEFHYSKFFKQTKKWKIRLWHPATDLKIHLTQHKFGSQFLEFLVEHSSCDPLPTHHCFIGNISLGQRQLNYGVLLLKYTTKWSIKLSTELLNTMKSNPNIQCHLIYYSVNRYLLHREIIMSDTLSLGASIEIRSNTTDDREFKHGDSAQYMGAYTSLLAPQAYGCSIRNASHQQYGRQIHVLDWRIVWSSHYATVNFRLNFVANLSQNHHELVCEFQTGRMKKLIFNKKIFVWHPLAKMSIKVQRAVCNLKILNFSVQHTSCTPLPNYNCSIGDHVLGNRTSVEETRDGNLLANWTIKLKFNLLLKMQHHQFIQCRVTQYSRRENFVLSDQFVSSTPLTFYAKLLKMEQLIWARQRSLSCCNCVASFYLISIAALNLFLIFGSDIFNIES